ncbi:MAG: c-type cytochrome [Thermodesulfobacteriota bacterium]|jgi:cytochrome c553
MQLVKRVLLFTTMAAAATLAAVEVLFGRRFHDRAPLPPSPGTASAESNLKKWSFRIAGLLLAGALGGFLVVASGIIPIKASGGHWAITAWFLHFAMRRSVVTHSFGLEAPPLDDPGLVAKGAGHYDFGCRPCHGDPQLPQPRIARGMTPFPPYLPPEIPKWEPHELFYIVKHGVKFTGMPAWPAQQRDDEVWAIVAFLRKFPQLGAEEYRRLAQGEAAPSGEVAPLPDLVGPERVHRAITTSCARCHGVDGLGRGLGVFPKLAGQKPAYLDLSLQAFARGWRHSGIMEPIAAGLSQEEIRELARYYASLPTVNRHGQQRSGDLPGPQGGARHAAPLQPLAIERGKEIASRGIPGQRVPACVHCHGPGATRRNPAYPELAGQYADYLALQLELFRKGHRGGTAYAHIMHEVADELTPEQMRDVALYYASLPPALDPRHDNW